MRLKLITARRAEFDVQYLSSVSTPRGGHSGGLIGRLPKRFGEKSSGAIGAGSFAVDHGRPSSGRQKAASCTPPRLPMIRGLRTFPGQRRGYASSQASQIVISRGDLTNCFTKQSQSGQNDHAYQDNQPGQNCTDRSPSQEQLLQTDVIEEWCVEFTTQSFQGAHQP